MYVVAVYIFEIYVNFTTTKKEQRNADDRCHFNELNLLIKSVEKGQHIFILSNICFICFNCLFQNTPKMFTPPSARRNLFKWALPNLKSWIRPWYTLHQTPQYSWNTAKVGVKNQSINYTTLIYHSNMWCIILRVHWGLIGLLQFKELQRKINVEFG